MNTQNIASLAEALEKLGFDASLQTSINVFIQLQLPRFNVHYSVFKERDVLTCNLLFQRKEDNYSCLYYDATLRKEIVLPDTIIDNISVKELDDQMKAIEWKELFSREQNIAAIINDLKTLELSKEAKHFSEQLKVKHWSDTALENIMGISFVKSRYEISQRFYFPENGEGICVKEAYRFLNNKWMERQARKKVNDVGIESKPVNKIKSKKSKPSKS